MTRSEACKVVESLARLHENYPEVLVLEIGYKLDASTGADLSVARDVLVFARERAREAVLKIKNLERQSEQYRAKAERLGGGNHAERLMELAADNDLGVQTIKAGLSARLIDRRYRTRE